MQVKLKSGAFPQIDTAKVFTKHKVAKPKRKHVVESLSQAKHKVSKPKHKKGHAKHKIIKPRQKKNHAKHAIPRKHVKVHSRKQKERKAEKEAKFHHKKKHHHFDYAEDECSWKW